MIRYMYLTTLIVVLCITLGYSGGYRLLSEIEYEHKNIPDTVWDTTGSDSTIVNIIPSGIIKMRKVLKDGKIVTESPSHPGITMTDIRRFRNYRILNKYGNLGSMSVSLWGKVENLENDDTISIRANLNTVVTPGLLTELSIDYDNVYSCYTCDVDTLKATITKAKLLELCNDYRFESIKYGISPSEQSGGDENCEECSDTTVETPMWLVKNIINPPADIELEALPSWYRGKSESGEAINCATVEGGIYLPYRNELYNSLSGTATFGHIHSRTQGHYHKDGTFGCMARIASHGGWNHLSVWNYDTIEYYDIQTLSQSYTGDSSVFSYGEKDSWVYKDDVRPLLCSPASNWGLNKRVNWCHFNHLSVGGATLQKGDGYGKEYFEINEIPTAYKDRFFNERTNDWENDTLLSASLGTQGIRTNVRNITDTLLSVKTDRELPHVVSMSNSSCFGVFDDIQMKLNYDDSTSVSSSWYVWEVGGTSAAAPFTNGVAATVISANPSIMKNRPTRTKVAIMATAINIDGGYWNPLEDGRDGCGVVSGYDAVTFIHDSCTFHNSTNESNPTTHGLAYDVLANHDNKYDNVKYHFKAPADFSKFKNRHFRAVLAWTSSVSTTKKINEVSDLDLILRDDITGEIVDLCASIDDNVEVIDVELKDLVPSRNYTIEIVIDTIAIPEIHVVKQYIKYALAWTFPQDYRGKRVANNMISFNDHDYSYLNRNLNVGPLHLKKDASVSVRATNQIVLEQGTILDSGSFFTAELSSPVTLTKTHNSGYNSDKDDRSGDLRHPVKSNVKRQRKKFYSQNAWYFDGINSKTTISQPQGDTVNFKNGLSVVAEVSVAGLQKGGTIFCVDDKNGGYAEFKLVGNELRFSYASKSGYRASESAFIPNDLIDEVMGHKTRLNSLKPLPAWVVVGVSWERNKEIKFFANYKLLDTFNSRWGNRIAATDGSMTIGVNSSGEYFEGGISDYTIFDGPISDTAMVGIHRIGSWPAYRGSLYTGKIEIIGNGSIHLKNNTTIDDLFITDTLLTTSSDTTTHYIKMIKDISYDLIVSNPANLLKVEYFDTNINSFVDVSLPASSFKLSEDDKRKWKFHFGK